MRRRLSRFGWLFAFLFPLVVMGCDVDVKDPGEAPTVDVEPGEMPDVDVEGPDVDVDTERRDVTVPDVDVDVQPEETEVLVPDIDVTTPDENQ